VEGFWQDGGFDIFLSRNAEDGGTSDEEEEEEEEEEEDEAAGGEEGGEKKPKAKKKKKRDEESESDFEPSDEDASDSEEYDTPSDEDSDSDDSDDGDDGSEGSDGEKSMDWDELDEHAKKQDRERAMKARERQGSDADLSSGDGQTHTNSGRSSLLRRHLSSLLSLLVLTLTFSCLAICL